MIIKPPAQEIVNATLLEIFLLFSFLLLAVLASLKEDLSELSALKKGKESSESALREAERAKNQMLSVMLQYKSNIQPDCPSQLDAGGKNCDKETCFAKVTIQGGDYDFVINREEPGFNRGDRFILSHGEFKNKFLNLFTHYQKFNCKLRVFAEDTEGTSKADYKKGRAVLGTYFYVR